MVEIIFSISDLILCSIHIWNANHPFLSQLEWYLAIWTELEQPVTVCVILFHTDNDTITLVVAILPQPVLMLECTGTTWTELATWVPCWEYLGLWDPWPVPSSAVQEGAGLLELKHLATVHHHILYDLYFKFPLIPAEPDYIPLPPPPYSRHNRFRLSHLQRTCPCSTPY